MPHWIILSHDLYKNILELRYPCKQQITQNWNYIFHIFLWRPNINLFLILHTELNRVTYWRHIYWNNSLCLFKKLCNIILLEMQNQFVWTIVVHKGDAFCNLTHKFLSFFVMHGCVKFIIMSLYLCIYLLQENYWLWCKVKGILCSHTSFKFNYKCKPVICETSKLSRITGVRVPLLVSIGTNWEKSRMPLLAEKFAYEKALKWLKMHKGLLGGWN